MALLTDDCDLNDNKLIVVLGGNGDFYPTIIFRDNDGYWQRKAIRIATSGGIAPTEVKLAIAELYRAMEKYNLNKV